MNEKAEAADVPTQDERIMAALAHVTVIWPTLGMIAPIVIWGTQREKSPFVGFQALQAAAYQFILILGGLVAGVCYVCSFFSIPFTAMCPIFHLLLHLRPAISPDVILAGLYRVRHLRCRFGAPGARLSVRFPWLLA